MSTRTWRALVGLSLLLLLFLLAPGHLAAGNSASVAYRRVFKSSVPEFIEIKVSDAGECTYDIRQLDEPANPQAFEVGSALRAKIFQLAAQLNYFRDLDLDIRRRIANLGQKTFRYERGKEAYEASFNYTINKIGRASCRERV